MPQWASRFTLEITKIKVGKSGDIWEWVISAKAVSDD
jgi:hypothetical protein